MPSPLSRYRVQCRCALALLGSLGSISGCATSTVVAPAPPSASVASAEPPTTQSVPIVRYGRYTLIELVPNAAQRDLLQQVVDISIPSRMDTTVGDALRHVLRRSGYRLCDVPRAVALYSLPLPAAHLHLGPLVLRDALLTLAGPAWNLSIDDATREVCFSLAIPALSPDTPRSDLEAPAAPIDAATSFAVPESQP